MVPHCREEGERKEARAKERGRKRGKKVDGEEEEASRGGLHKLEILQVSLSYLYYDDVLISSGLGNDFVYRRTGSENRHSGNSSRRRTASSPSPRPQQSQSTRLPITFFLPPLPRSRRSTRSKCTRLPTHQLPLFESQLPHNRSCSSIEYDPAR